MATNHPDDEPASLMPDQGGQSDSLDREETRRGYPTSVFLGRPEDKFMCVSCVLVLYKAYQSFCGHRYCKGCLLRARDAGSEARCVACVRENTVEEYSDLTQTFADRALRRELGRLGVRCLAELCPWSGVLNDFDDHVDRCELCTVTCECGARVQQIWLARHSEAECPLGTLQCQFGCETPVRRRDLQTHNQHSAHLHVTHLLTLFNNCETNMTSDTQNGASLTDASNKVHDLEAKMKSLQESINISTQRETPAIQDTNYNAPTPPPDGAGLLPEGHNVTELDAAVTDLSARLEGLLDRVADRMALTSTMQRSTLEEQRQAGALRLKVTSLESSLRTKDTELTELESRIVNAEVTTYDGVFVWRVDGWNRKLEDARAGRTPWVYSPSFYTSRSGTRHRLRVYPYGDGSGKGSHVSLYFVIMRGQHDAIQTWPFVHKVTLMMLDQEGGHHLVETFRPDPGSSSFRRPLSDTNVASGCPRFAPHDDLRQGDKFVKDDTCFFKVKISLTN